MTFHVMQRDTSGLSSENKELKFRLEAMEQHAHLRDGNCNSLNFILSNHNYLYFFFLGFLL